MGDVLTLIERAEESFDADVAARGAARLQEGSFTLDDFLEQMQQIKKMGPLQGVLGMLPGMPKELKNAQIDDRELARVEAIICSMTLKERSNPSIINGSRRLRIANGSGTATSAVNALIRQFGEAQRMFKMAGLGPRMAKARAAKSKKRKGRR
jgi:signal recognition particle subunit SRP54